jgi:hypothetical protein
MVVIAPSPHHAASFQTVHRGSFLERKMNKPPVSFSRQLTRQSKNLPPVRLAIAHSSPIGIPMVPARHNESHHGAAGLRSVVNGPGHDGGPPRIFEVGR